MAKDSPNPNSEEPPPRLVDAQGRTIALGGALRRAWVGYQQRLDEQMAAAGFSDRHFPDGRVLRLCAGVERTTAAQIARELAITRQGAGKIIAALEERGYLELRPSTTDAREKTITLTSLAHRYLTQQHQARAQIEQSILDDLGPEAFSGLSALLELLSGDSEPPRLRDYLGRAARREL